MYSLSAKTISHAILLVFCGGAVFTASSAEWFNPAFISGDSQSVDLTRFEHSLGQLPGAYRVEIWVNDQFVTSRDVSFIDSREWGDNQVSGGDITGHNDSGLAPCLSAAYFSKLGVNLSAVPDIEKYAKNECIPFPMLIEGAFFNFDFGSQRLYLSLPQAFMQNSAKGYIPPEQWDEGVNAALLNYSISGSNGNNSTSHYINLNDGLNIGPWRLRNNSAWSYTRSGSYRYSKWSNISTYAERSIIPLRSQFVVGDSSSSSMVFDSLSFRGVRLYSNDSMYPDSQQGYAPVVRGVASSRAKITIKQNGYSIYQNWVQAGPFEINDLNPTTSSGDLLVTVEGDDKSVQTFTVPYSTVSMLQREGHASYDMVAGKYRSGSSSYNTPSWYQVTLAAGLPGDTTLYGGSQFASAYKSLALGAGKNMGRWGAVSADITGAWSELTDGSTYSGQSLRFLYAKSLNSFGTNIRLMGYRYSTRGFYTLDETAYKNMSGYEYEMQVDDEGHYVPVLTSYHNLRRSKKGKLQMNLTQQLGGYGSVYISGTQQSYWNQSRDDTSLQAGWSGTLAGVNLNLALSHSSYGDIGRPNNQVSLSMSLPLGQWLAPAKVNPFERNNLQRINATSSLTHSSTGGDSLQAGLSGTALDDGSLSYSLSKGHSSRSGNTGSLTGSLRGTYGTAGLGYSYSDYSRNINWSFNGGAILHRNGLTLGQSLGDSNILVRAPGAAGVALENQTGVRTDWRGYAIVPYATDYRRNRVALDVNTLDDRTELEDSVAFVVPTKGAVVQADYNTRTGLRSMITLSKRGRAVPFGAVVTEKSSGASGIIGDDGMVYLSGLPVSGVLKVQWGEGVQDRCTVRYRINHADRITGILRAEADCESGKDYNWGGE